MRAKIVKQAAREMKGDEGSLEEGELSAGSVALPSATGHC